MKKLNEMFHIEDDQLIKSSNGEPVPIDEPLFILRARDCCAYGALKAYYKLCEEVGTPVDRLDAIFMLIGDFYKYRDTHKTKVPGSTHGH